jgi:hypothetical protein
VQPDGGSRRRGGQQVEQTEDVRRWRRDLESVIRPEPETLLPVLGGVAHGRVRVADRLRQTGRAGAEHEQGIVGIENFDGRSIGSAAGEDRVEHRVVVEIGDVVGPERIDEQSGGGSVDHRVSGAGECERVPDLDLLPRRADEHRGSAGPTDALNGDDELGAIGGHDRDPVAVAHTPVDEVPSEGVGQAVEFAIRQSGVARPDGVMVAELRRRPLEESVHRSRGHRKHSSRS